MFLDIKDTIASSLQMVANVVFDGTHKKNRTGEPADVMNLSVYLFVLCHIEPSVYDFRTNPEGMVLLAELILREWFLASP
jgi:hypothetical protein